MNDSDIRYNHSSSIKTHEEIISLIEEIKEIEKKFDKIGDDYEIKKEFIEQKAIEEIEEEPTPIKIDVEEPKKRFIFKLKRPKAEAKVVKKCNYATFRLRIDDKGNLVNIDLREQKPREKGRFALFLNRLIKRKEKSSEDKEKNPEETGSKLKTVFSKLVKLKKVIPFKGKE